MFAIPVRSMKTAAVWLILLLFYGMPLNVPTSEASSYEIDDSYLPILTLNYCHYSLAKIMVYNDKIILDEEYSEIINNIDLSKINDEEIILILKQLMDTLTEFKLDDRSRKKFYNSYQNQVENAVYQSMSQTFGGNSNSKGNIRQEKSGENIQNASKSYVKNKAFSVLTKGPQIAAAETLLQAGSAYANYRRLIEEYRDNFDDNIWKLENDAIVRINEVNKAFLEAYWRLLKKYNAPDNLRLTMDQLKTLISVSKDTEKDRQHRNLCRLEKDLEFFPPYWFHRAESAYNIGAFDDVTYSIDRFLIRRQDFFRYDNLLADVLMMKARQYDYTEQIDNIVEILQEINSCQRRDFRKIMFTGLIYAQYGLFEEAEMALQECIDNDWNTSVVTGFLAQIKARDMNGGQTANYLSELLKDTKTRNQDILPLINIIPQQVFLHNFKEQILNVNIFVDDPSLLSNSSIKLSLPFKWVLDEPKTLNAIVEYNGKNFHTVDTSLDKEIGYLMLTYKDVIDHEELFDGMRPKPVIIHIHSKTGMLRIFGEFVPMIRKVEKGLISKKASETTNFWKTKIGLGPSDDSNVDFKDHYYTDFRITYVRPNSYCFKVDETNLTLCQ